MRISLGNTPEERRSNIYHYRRWRREGGLSDEAIRYLFHRISQLPKGVSPDEAHTFFWEATNLQEADFEPQRTLYKGRILSPEGEIVPIELHYQTTPKAVVGKGGSVRIVHEPPPHIKTAMQIDELIEAAQGNLNRLSPFDPHRRLTIRSAILGGQKVGGLYGRLQTQLIESILSVAGEEMTDTAFAFRGHVASASNIPEGYRVVDPKRGKVYGNPNELLRYFRDSDSDFETVVRGLKRGTISIKGKDIPYWEGAAIKSPHAREATATRIVSIEDARRVGWMHEPLGDITEEHIADLQSRSLDPHAPLSDEYIEKKFFKRHNKQNVAMIARRYDYAEIAAAVELKLPQARTRLSRVRQAAMEGVLATSKEASVSGIEAENIVERTVQKYYEDFLKRESQGAIPVVPLDTDVVLSIRHSRELAARKGSKLISKLERMSGREFKEYTKRLRNSELEPISWFSPETTTSTRLEKEVEKLAKLNERIAASHVPDPSRGTKTVAEHLIRVGIVKVEKTESKFVLRVSINSLTTGNPISFFAGDHLHGRGGAAAFVTGGVEIIGGKPRILSPYEVLVRGINTAVGPGGWQGLTAILKEETREAALRGKFGREHLTKLNTVVEAVTQIAQKAGTIVPSEVAAEPGFIKNLGQTVNILHEPGEHPSVWLKRLRAFAEETDAKGKLSVGLFSTKNFGTEIYARGIGDVDFPIGQYAVTHPRTQIPVWVQPDAQGNLPRYDPARAQDQFRFRRQGVQRPLNVLVVNANMPADASMAWLTKSGVEATRLPDEYIHAPSSTSIPKGWDKLSREERLKRVFWAEQLWGEPSVKFIGQDHVEQNPYKKVTLEFGGKYQVAPAPWEDIRVAPGEGFAGNIDLVVPLQDLIDKNSGLPPGARLVHYEVNYGGFPVPRIGLLVENYSATVAVTPGHSTLPRSGNIPLKDPNNRIVGDVLGEGVFMKPQRLPNEVASEAVQDLLDALRTVARLGRQR